MEQSQIDQQRAMLVVKDNDLIQKARYNLTATQQKFLAFLISKIKPEDDELKIYEIRVDDFCEVTGIDKTRFYTEFKKMVNSFENRDSNWVVKPDEVYRIYWFSDASYLPGKGTIRIGLGRRIAPYLLGLKQNFTQYELYNILALKSKYAIRLFELFKSYSYQKSKEFDIDEIKEILYVTNYKNYADFSKRVLKPAICEINEYTELDVALERICKGKKVIRVRFIITRKDSMNRYRSYRRTIDRITSKEKQVDGQMTIFDL